jgi:hypothetical protein
LATDSVELPPDERLCLTCRYEWKPAETTGPLERGEHVAVNTTPAQTPADDVLPAAPDLAAQVAAARAMLTGKTVLYFAEGIEGVVLDVFDTGYAAVEFYPGLILDLLPDEFTPIVDSGIPDDVVTALGAADLQAAAMTVRAAVTTIVTDMGHRRLGIPPAGWAPADLDALTIIEHGAAYAVAVVVLAAGLPTEQLSDIATMLDDAATAAKGATNNG